MKIPRTYGIFPTLSAAALLTALLATAGPAAARTRDRADGEALRRLQGRVVAVANPTIPFADGTLDLWLTGRTTESDLVTYSAVARRDGERALRNRLSDADLGRLSIGGEIGKPIALVQETRDEGLRRLVIVVDRQPDPREVFFATRSSDYPYTVVDLVVDADGHGFGELYGAASLEVSPDGKLTYDALDEVPFRVLHVSPT